MYELTFDFDVLAAAQHQAGTWVTSRSYVLGDCFIHLYVYPQGHDEDSKGYISAFFNVQPIRGWRESDSFNAELRITMINHVMKGLSTQSVTKKLSHEFSFSNQQAWGWSHLKQMPSPDHLQKEGWVNERGQLQFEGWVKGEFSCSHSLPVVNHELLCSIGLNLWKNKMKFSDMTVETEEGSKIHCHRSVLSSASAVFDKMLCSDMHEGREACIKLDGIESADASALVEYMYTGCFPNNSNINVLLKLADMYALPELAKTCAQMMAASLSEATVLEALYCLRLHRSAGDGEVEHFFHDAIAVIKSDTKLLRKVYQHLLHEKNDQELSSAVLDHVLNDDSLLVEIGRPLLTALQAVA